MRLITRLALAASAMTMISVSVAAAADLGPTVIDPEPVPEPPAALGGWYLRGDISYDFETKGRIFVFTSASSTSFIDMDFDDAWNIGVGLGYIFNDWFRADITGDIRTPAYWEGVETDVAISTIMLNGYATLGSFSGVSPYVGAGIGGAYVDWSSINGPTFVAPFFVNAYANDPQWRFAWALMAGVSFDVTDRWAIDAGYRYTAIGDGTIVFDDPLFPGGIDYRDMEFHEFRVGARVMLGG
jgi:opacity protein-like surface antigen